MSEATATVDTEATESDAPAEDEEFSLEDLTKDDLISVAEERGVEVKKSWSRSKILAALLGGGEQLSIIRSNMWVRFGSENVPNHLVGRHGVVLHALVKQAEGGDAFSPNPYEYQDGSEEFLVRARDTGETLTLTRESFASFATDEVFLTAA